MPSARKKGTKLAGAYIEDAKDEALAKLAAEQGYPDKATFIRALFDAALEGHSPKSSKRAAKKNT